jgi:hypothetical protein
LAQQADANRAQIFQTFKEIPITIMTAQYMRNLFPDDDELEQCANKLYVTLIHAITDLIAFLLPKSSCKPNKPGVAFYFILTGKTAEKVPLFSTRSTLSTSQIAKVVENVREESQTLQRLAEKLKQKTLVELLSIAKDSKIHIQEILDLSNAINVKSEDLHVLAQNNNIRLEDLYEWTKEKDLRDNEHLAVSRNILLGVNHLAVLANKRENEVAYQVTQQSNSDTIRSLMQYLQAVERDREAQQGIR